MEDLDLIIRISKEIELKAINAKIYTDNKKWRDSNVLQQGFKNFILRKRWLKGESEEILYKDYYANL